MATEKRRIHRVVDTSGKLVQVLPETIAEQVKLADTADKYTSTDVEGALAEVATKIDELETGITEAGKVDDVQDVNGNTIVVDKIAKLSKAAVGLGNVDNTADADKTVKKAGTADEATKVSSKLTIKNETKNFAEYDGAMPIGLTFKDADFALTQVVNNGVSIGIKDKGYSTKSYVDAELAKKYDKTGGPISGNVSVSGDVVISGGLTVKGPTTTVESETLQVKDALITVAKDNVLPLTSPAGILVPKADGTNDVALVVDNDNMASVGKVVLDGDGNIDKTQSSLQTLATRTGLVDDKLVKWDGTNKTLVPDTREYTTGTDLIDDTLVKWDDTAKTLKADTRQYAQKNIDDTISGDWEFTNANGFKTNAIENRDGNRIFDYDGTNNRFGSEAKPTIVRGSLDRPQYIKNGGSAKNIALVEDIIGDNVTVANAKNVTETIAGKKITDIFENNSTIVKKSTLAETANVANKVANALTVSGQNGNGTEQTVTYNGSSPITVDYDGSDFTTTVENGTLAVELVDTGVVPSGQDTAVFSAVQVNRKGIVENGGFSMEWGVAGQTTPSNTLMVRGLFWELTD